jgi:hypothetical protein
MPAWKLIGKSICPVLRELEQEPRAALDSGLVHQRHVWVVYHADALLAQNVRCVYIAV